MTSSSSRRVFLKQAGASAVAMGLARPASAWEPTTDRKIKVGIAGFGVCKFGAKFSFQHHPNVEVVAVTDLIPDRCAALASACKVEKTYPSLETMLDDDAIEAVFIATDAPSHARHSIAALQRGKHVACAVPAVFERVEDAQALFDAVRKSGLNYMMFETSAFRPDLYAMRRLYEAGALGKLVYSEGEYWHNACAALASYKDWRIGLPPQWYPTHSNAYYVSVTGKSFTEVSCYGIRSARPELQPENNRYKNGFGTEIAQFRTSEGGAARMAVSWDTPGHEHESGRVRGHRGSVSGTRYQGVERSLPDIKRPPLPEGVQAGGHGGSHGHLTHEFVLSILEKRRPLIDVTHALNLTVPGMIAHESALKDGELLKIPQYRW